MSDVVTNAEAGTTLRFTAGTVADALTVDKSLTFSGVNRGVSQNHAQTVDEENATQLGATFTVDNAEADVVLDGVDFTENGYIVVNNAKSVTIKNARFYGLADTAAKTYPIKISSTNSVKVDIQNCYFGDSPAGTTGQVYNIIEPNAPMKDGSVISNNYFTRGALSHNCISVYQVEEGATIRIENNTFGFSDGTVRIGVQGSPACTFEINNNTVLEIDEGNPTYQGLVLVQPYGKQTATFANMVINMANNTMPCEQQIYTYYGTNDLVLTRENLPQITVDGENVTQTVAIVH